MSVSNISISNTRTTKYFRFVPNLILATFSTLQNIVRTALLYNIYCYKHSELFANKIKDFLPFFTIKKKHHKFIDQKLVNLCESSVSIPLFFSGGK